MVKFLVQISFIVNLCLIFVYSKDVDGSDSRRNRLYFWWEESQSEIGLEGHGHREGKTLWLLYNLPHLENLNYNEWMSQLKQESLFFFLLMIGFCLAFWLSNNNDKSFYFFKSTWHIEQLQVHSKTEWKVQSSHIPSAPMDLASPPSTHSTEWNICHNSWICVDTSLLLNFDFLFILKYILSLHDLFIFFTQL